MLVCNIPVRTVSAKVTRFGCLSCSDIWCLNSRSSDSWLVIRSEISLTFCKISAFVFAIRLGVVASLLVFAQIIFWVLVRVSMSLAMPIWARL